MSVEASKKILRYALNHASFRASLRSSPRDAIEAYKQEIGVAGPGVLSVAELDALVTLTDADYDSIREISSGFGESPAAETTGNIIF